MSLVAVIGVELAVIVVAGLWFIAAFPDGRPWRHVLRDPISLHLMAMTGVGVGEALTFLLALLGVALPMLWLFAVGYGLIDAVMVHRLVLLYWARRKR